jgi:hypothetical protein
MGNGSQTGKINVKWATTRQNRILGQIMAERSKFWRTTIDG